MQSPNNVTAKLMETQITCADYSEHFNVMLLASSGDVSL